MPRPVPSARENPAGADFTQFFAARRPPRFLRPAAERKKLALGPVSRILFGALRRPGRHFSHAHLAMGPACEARPGSTEGEPNTGGAGCGIPVAVGRATQPPILPCTGRGFSCRRRRRRRGGLLPHLFTLAARLPARRYVFCDTVRRGALKRRACARGEAGTASCPAVSGLSSPNFPKRARRLTAPWDQRTRSDGQAPKLRGQP